MKTANIGRAVTLSIIGATLFLAFAAMGARPAQPASQPSSDPTGDGPTNGEPTCGSCIPLPDPPPVVPDPQVEKPRCGTHDGWRCCQDSCAGGMRCVREQRRVPTVDGRYRSVGVKVCRRPPRPRIRQAHSERIELGGGLFGARDERVVGGACPAGTARTTCSAAAESSGQCYAVDTEFGSGWVSDSPNDCRCRVHLGVPAFQSLACAVHVSSKG